MNELDIRLEALRLALVHFTDPTDVVKAATEYYDYVMGKK